MYIHKYLRGPEVFYWKFVHHIRLYTFLFEGEITHNTCVKANKHSTVPASAQKYPHVTTNADKYQEVIWLHVFSSIKVNGHSTPAAG